MKYIDEYRDGELAQRIAARIRGEAHPDRSYRFMEFCGGHTHAISRYGVSELLPDNVRMIHGPGCPVCVLPIGRIDLAVKLALEHGAILCSYGDTLRVPASEGLSLLRAKAHGADIRMIYSPLDALKIAEANPERQVVFFAIGFETTTPPTALIIREAAARGLDNFSVLCCHVLTPAAISHILAAPEKDAASAVELDGFVGPAHVSIVIGSAPYEAFARQYHKPVVIAGFEPLDVMQAILMLVRQVNEGRAEVENEFIRAVGRYGNTGAQALMDEVFELRPSFEWRGLGEVPLSALRIRPAFARYDAEVRFDLEYQAVPDHKACECGAILRGQKKPTDCRLFGTVCTPENPMGSCMVSNEGACAAHYAYGRYKDIEVVAL
ncbi:MULTISPECIES: hydrogenase formation protein HypD [unclassified Pseudomonas]|uniref:hydrogenase formation protein HypD n=1 Tax=unclassified Pseudomonas TaxID=196821 RepID=UPI002B23DC50|nr:MULTISPECIES: hydrogenase formation protein HypD [unclassified Pseudomonas]MEB0007343.1 hydrogenase formation protein HypD [Pseudomonas sp. RTB2]MEB0015761.1 hydrogenase formation protein HypD [Pseudomonas sp. RTB3]MEB0146746.1 hydrogenase formation protein HypD [Pseudomonas sp. CCC2.2]MEB0269628.1 hydrogenase formation protein HypD [Pseudomonas sp. 5B4]